MKKKICGLFVTLLICVMALTPLPCFAAETYNPDAALEYANSHYDDGKGACAEFVSDTLRAGGVSAYSTSCNSLRSQLVNSGLVTEYIVGNFDGSINVANIPQISPGDIIFFHCSKCQNIDGKPLIHAVIYRDEVDGKARCYSHNNSNGANKAYWYSKTCWSCGAKVDSIYIEHFEGESNRPPIGCLDLVESTKAGTVRIAGWAFDPDNQEYHTEVHAYIGGLAENPTAEGHGAIIASDSGRDDVNAAYGILGTHGFDLEITTEKVGRVPIYVYAIDDKDSCNNVLLGYKYVNISEPPKSGKVSLNAHDINMSVGETCEVVLSYSGCADAKTVYPVAIDGDSRIIAVNRTGFENEKVLITYSAQKPGTLTLKYRVVDSYGNELGNDNLTFNISAAQKEDKNESNISEESSTSNEITERDSEYVAAMEYAKTLYEYYTENGYPKKLLSWCIKKVLVCKGYDDASIERVLSNLGL